MDNLNIEIKCEGCGLFAELEKENIINNCSNKLELNFSYNELNRVINKLNDLKSLINYNKNETKISQT